MKRMCGPSKMGTILFFGAFLLLTYCNQPSESLKILAIYPINSKSHFAMFESLVKYLAAKGHQMDVYSQYTLKKAIPNYNDYSLEGSLPHSHNNMTYDEVILLTNGNFQNVIALLGNSVCETLDHPKIQDLFKSLKRGSSYDLVIVQALLANCFLGWGRYLNIPMVGLTPNVMMDWYNPSLGNPTNAIRAINYNSMDFLERVKTFVGESIFSTMIKYSLSGQNQHVSKHFGSGYPDIIELQKDIDLLLINSHFSLDSVKPYTPAVIPVAGLHIKDNKSKLKQDVQEWLDDSKSGCIYFTLGSMVRIETFPKAILNKIYATFKKIAPVRVLMKVAKPSDLASGLPSNVMIQSWFDQESVLRHKNVKLFITHGGLMGILESIYYAVPMIGMPLFGDQEKNVISIVNKGIGRRIDIKNITEHGLTSEIVEVLYNPIYQENMNKLSNLFTDRPMKPLELATYWIEYVARHGKNCLRSPLVDMPWWKASFIDVYAFILVNLGIAAFILKLLWKFLLKPLICHFICKQNNPPPESKKQR